jgi:hypothetical protein
MFYPTDRTKLIPNSSLKSRIVTVAVKSKIFNLHYDLLVAESEMLSRSLKGNFKEASDNAIKIEEEDPELFGFFVEYMYRDCSILSRELSHYSEYVILARLYAMGERLMALRFKSQCLWRFTQSLGTNTAISDESICELLHIACTQITQRGNEDPMRLQIFWYAGIKIKNIQKFDMYRQLLRDEPEVGRQMCLWVDKPQPPKAAQPIELEHKRFEPESEYSLTKTSQDRPSSDNEQDGEKQEAA